MTLIQNTVENNHIDAITESSGVLQSEVPSEAGGRVDEVLTSITNLCRQVLESRIHLTFENRDRLLQIYNEPIQLLPVNEEMQLPSDINMQTQRKIKKVLISSKSLKLSLNQDSRQHVLCAT
jgi:thiamine pyrophosphokinase